MINQEIVANPRSPHPPAPYSPWPRAIISFFIILALFNALLVYWALSSQNSSMDKNPYERGLTYQQIIDQKDAATRAGLEPIFTVSELSSAGERAVVFKLVNATGKNLSGAKVQIDSMRLSDSSLDSTTALVERGDGYEGKIKFSASGLWLFRIAAELSGQKYYFELNRTLK